LNGFILAQRHYDLPSIVPDVTSLFDAVHESIL